MTELLVHPTTKEQVGRLITDPPHALLLTGVQGVGKTELASQLLAGALDIDRKKLTTYPYFMELEAGVSKVGIESVRSLLRFFELTVPGNSAIARAALISDAEQLSGQAQNTLLKLIEEPPERSIIVLTSAEPTHLLNTIMSRMQKIHVRAPTSQQLLEFFGAQGFEGAAIRKAQALTQSSPGRMQAILSDNANQFTSAADIAKQILAADHFSRLSMIDSQLKDKEFALSVIDALIATISAASKQADGTRLTRWQRSLQAAITAQSALNHNVNPKLVLTELMLSL